MEIIGITWFGCNGAFERMTALRPAFTDRRLWILDPGRDMLLFVLPMAWILPIIWLLGNHFDLNAFGVVLLAVGSAGHHLPGFLRAYTDPNLFRRYRWRFILAPLFFLSVCLAFAWFNLQSLKLILVLWGMWHGAMQVNGFLRIYDSKAGSIAAATAWLDWAMCLAWFGGGILHSSTRLMGLFAYFYGSGGSLIPPDGFLAFRSAWDIFILGVTFLFAVNAWRQSRQGRLFNPIKPVIMVSSFAFWWFAMVKVDNLLLGLVLFEIFHDVQYNAMVWVYNGKRVAGGSASSPVESFLFRSTPARLVLYIGIVLAYGWLGVVFDYATPQTAMTQAFGKGAMPIWSSLFMVSGFLHFYFDGFLWRVRDPHFRSGLGLAGSPIPAEQAKRNKPAREWTLWLFPGLKWSLLFVLPAAALGFTEYRGKMASELDQYRNMALIIPENWYVNFALGSMEMAKGESDPAIQHLERVVADKPDFGSAQATLAALYLKQGNKDSAVAHYSRAALLDPNDEQVGGLLGKLLLSQGKVNEALPHLRQTVEWDPQNKYALNNLGIALQTQGKIGEAAEYYRRAFAVDPQFSSAKTNLDQAQKILASGR